MKTKDIKTASDVANEALDITSNTSDASKAKVEEAQAIETNNSEHKEENEKANAEK